MYSLYMSMHVLIQSKSTVTPTMHHDERCDLLGRLFHSSVLLEVLHELLHVSQGVGEVAVRELYNGHLNPFEQVRTERVILHFHVLCLNHLH